MVSDGTPVKVDIDLTDQFHAPIAATDGSVKYRILSGNVMGEENDEQTGKEVESSVAQFDAEQKEMEAYGYSIYEFEVYGLKQISTGIHQVAEHVPSKYADAAVYDLNGRKVSSGATSVLRPGVYVKGGKKIVVE